MTPANVRATIDLLERTVALLEERGLAEAITTELDDPAVKAVSEFWNAQSDEVRRATDEYTTAHIAHEMLASGRLQKLMVARTPLAGMYRAMIEHARMKLLELEFAR